MNNKIKLTLTLAIIFLIKSLGRGQGVLEYSDKINELGGQLPNKEILVIIDNLYQQKVINQEGKKQLIDFAENRTLPEIIKKDGNDSTLAKLDRFKGFAPLVLGQDSTKLNRAAILVILGLMDWANMDNTVIDKPSNLANAKINQIFGEKWNFVPQIIGDSKNPFSLKIDMAKNRTGYSNLLEGIYKSGLLDDKVYEDVKKWLDKKELYLFKDFSILFYAAVRTVYYDSYETLKNHQLSVMDTLVFANIIKPINEVKLKENFYDFTLMSKTAILKNSTYNFVLNADEIDIKNKEAVIRKVFDKIKFLLPEIEINNLKIETIDSGENNLGNPLIGAALVNLTKFIDFKKLLVSANINGKNYVKEINLTRVLHESIPDENLKTNINNLLQKGWLGTKDLQIFNDYLMDIGSDKRVYVVGDEFSVFPKSNGHEKVVLLLDKMQSSVLKQVMPLMAFSVGPTQDFDGLNSLESLKMTYNDLLATKIIEKLSDKKVEDLILQARRSSNNVDLKRDIILALLAAKPNVIVNGDIYKEKSAKPDLIKFINDLALSSKGSFKPLNIQSNFTADLNSNAVKDTLNFHISFEVDGEQYRDSLQVAPLLDHENNFNSMMGITRTSGLENVVMSLVKSASRDRKPYILTTKTNNYIFLTEDEYIKLNEKLDYIFQEVYKADNNISVVDSTSDIIEVTGFDAEAFMLELKGVDMMDDDGINKLKANFPEVLPSNKIEIWPYLKRGLEFDLVSNLKKGDIEYFKNLYKTVQQKFFPEIKLDKFSLKSDTVVYYKDTQNEYIEIFTRVSYTINGKNYFDEHQNHEAKRQDILEMLEQGTSSEEIYFNDLYFPQSAFNNYLADIGSEKRLVSEIIGSKRYFQYLTEPNTYILGYGMFGNATQESVSEILKKVIAVGLLKKVNDSKFEELVNKYRTIYSSLDINYLGQFAFQFENTSPFYTTNSDNKVIFSEIIAKISDNTLIVKDYNDNYASVLTKAEKEREKADFENRVQVIEYISSFSFNDKKIETNIELNKDDDYTLRSELLYRNNIMIINSELELMKNPNKFYMDDKGNLMFLNNVQYDFLKERGYYFIDF